MTPKEKANQIYLLIRYDVSVLKAAELLIDIVAKKCALIAVDEIIDSQKCCDECKMEGSIEMAYWQEVKYEINNL